MRLSIVTAFESDTDTALLSIPLHDSRVLPTRCLPIGDALYAAAQSSSSDIWLASGLTPGPIPLALAALLEATERPWVGPRATCLAHLQDSRVALQLLRAAGIDVVDDFGANGSRPAKRPSDTPALTVGVAQAAGGSRLAIYLPPWLSAETTASMKRTAGLIASTLGLGPFGLLYFSRTPAGAFSLLSLDSAPALHPESAWWNVCVAGGQVEPDVLIRAAVRHAMAPVRRSLALSKTKKGRAKVVGLAFNLKRIDPRSGDDSEAEFDSPTTVNAIEEAISSFGYQVARLEADQHLPQRLSEAQPDVVFNISEGRYGRGRESQVPALLDLLGIPYTGSDPATLALTLDKAAAKQVVALHGGNTPRFFVAHKPSGPKAYASFRFPMIAKPVAEGSSKGVFKSSVVRSPAELALRLEELCPRYPSGVLVEEFLPGREFTVGLLGHHAPRVLPPLEVVFLPAAGELPVYTFEHKQEASSEVRYDAPANIDARLARRLRSAARLAFSALQCRDVARIDFRLDAQGAVHFIECNPLPGLTPDWSDLCMIAKSAGLSYRELIGQILAPAIRRTRRADSQTRKVATSAPRWKGGVQQ